MNQLLEYRNECNACCFIQPLGLKSKTIRLSQFLLAL